VLLMTATAFRFDDQSTQLENIFSAFRTNAG